MADEENVVSSGEQQQTPAREKSSATLLDLVPMSVHLACIPCKSSFPLVHAELIHPIVLFLIEVHRLSLFKF